MSWRRARCEWLVSSLTLASALVAGVAQADEATGHGAPYAESKAAIALALELSGGAVSPPAQTYAEADPESERKREGCFHEKSLPWLPAVELPEPRNPGQAALGWRPRWLLSEPSSRGWIAGSLAALAVAIALALTRRHRWRCLALVAAAGPCLVGFALAHQHLDRLSEGLSQTWWCIPREGVFQRNAQLARDTLTLGAMASLPALVGLLVLALRPRHLSSLRTFAPASALMMLVAWLTWRHWPDGCEARLARDVSRVMAGVESAGLRLPDASTVARTRLPDVPLVLVSADGSLHYDDSRGHRTPTAMPALWREIVLLEEESRRRASEDSLPLDIEAIDGPM